MKPEETKIRELKVGEIYNVRVKVCINEASRVGVRAIDKNGNDFDYSLNWFAAAETAAFSPVTPENGTKNTAPAPKYDPCRKFRKGDKVELKEEIDGRKLSEFVTGLTLGKIYTVEEDEKNHTVVIDSDNGLCRYSFVHLKLVTPVEEQEPYKCGTGIDAQLIFINDELFAEFENEEDAKRVCALLNAEHRKEQK